MKPFIFGLMLAWGSHLHAASLIPIDTTQQQALGIRTAAVDAATHAWGDSYPARVRVPNAQLMVVSAPQEGLLSSLKLAAGEPVTEGQLLAVIQSPKLVEAQRLYLAALSRLALARAQLERDRQLKAEGIIAERRLLETRASHTQAKTEVEQRRQALQLAGMSNAALAQLEKKHKLSATLELLSPMDGVVLEQLATPGQRVEIASPIYHIGQLDPLWLEIQVPLEKLDQVAVGSAVKIDKPPLEGRIITIGGMIHGENQSVLVRAEVPNPAIQLRPGQFVEARLALPEVANSWRVPRQALLRVDGKTWVMAARDGGFEPIAVRITSEEPDTLVISGPLTTGDQVAINGTAALKAAWLEGDN